MENDIVQQMINFRPRLSPHDQAAGMRFARHRLVALQAQFDAILRTPAGTLSRRDALQRLLSDLDIVRIHVQHNDPEHIDPGWQEARDELKRRTRSELDAELGRCCVCLEPMVTYVNFAGLNRAARLPCGHCIHEGCALRITSGKCPMCRAPSVFDGMMFRDPGV